VWLVIGSIIVFVPSLLPFPFFFSSFSFFFKKKINFAFMLFSCTFVGVLMFFFCGLGFCLLILLKSDMLVETFVTGFRYSSTDPL
jgi:hypothetical protein